MKKLIYLGLIVWLICCSGIGNAGTYYCDNCSDCTEKINSASGGDTIYLTTNITAQLGDTTPLSLGCIELYSKEGVTFDCQGNNIAGVNSSDVITLRYDRGIYLTNSSNNIIKNCKLYRFNMGIYLFSSHNNTIIGNTANNNTGSFFIIDEEVYLYNGGCGIHIENSNTNILTNNTANYNEDYGITLKSFSENNTLIGNTINNNDYGVYLYHSNTNTITGNTINYNEYGVYFWYSVNNTLNSNHVCSQTYSDFQLIASSENSGNYNTCDNPDGWNDTETVGCSYSCSGTSTTTTTSTITSTTTTSTSTTSTTTTTTSTTTTSTTTSSTTTTIETCPLAGDYPPCGEVTLSEVVDFINQWAEGEAGLSDVVNLINVWAG